MNEVGDERTAERLKENAPHILETWKARVREAMPVARRTDPLALLDALPRFLEHLADGLADPVASAASTDEVAAEHGRQRALVTDYELDHVILEYDVLRQVMLEVLGEQEPLPASAQESLVEGIFLAVRSAAREFTRLRDDERDASQAALQLSHRELETRVAERVDQLQKSEERFRSFVQSVRDYAIFTLDPEGGITSWNEGCERMKGWTPAEAIGSHFSMLYPEEGRRRDEPMDHLRVARSEGRFRGEGVRQRKNGELFLADVSITPIDGAGNLIGFTKVVQDLTERSLLIQERDLSRTHAEAMVMEAEYRNRFIATLTHDLRSPLAAAMTGAELIARAPEKTEKVRTWAHRISTAVERTDRMISDLLDATRLQAGEQLPLEFEHTDLKPIVGELCDDLTTRHGTRFAVLTEGQTSGFWSPDGLRRVLDNLLVNAVKYGDAGQPVTVRVRSLADRLLLSVHNEGTMIATDDQEKLFVAYHRTSLARTSGKVGWGLGLTLVKGIVEAHRGIVKVESYPKEGTTFTIDLPLDSRPKPEGEPEPRL